MAVDTYVKFGEVNGIEGDSYDATHFYWCELRSCDIFELTPAQTGSTAAPGAGAAADPKPQFKEVTLKKRVDWASSALFTNCCLAGNAKIAKASAASAAGQMDQVTVHVCRATGETKLPFLIINYYNVQVTKYSIEMSSPEPSENISFQFETADYSYQPTSPITGLSMGAPSSALGLVNNKPTDASGGAGGGAAGGAGGGASGPTVTSGGNQPDNTEDGPSSPNSSASSNFPGLFPTTGPGILPD